MVKEVGGPEVLMLEAGALGVPYQVLEMWQCLYYSGEGGLSVETWTDRGLIFPNLRTPRCNVAERNMAEHSAASFAEYVVEQLNLSQKAPAGCRGLGGGGNSPQPGSLDTQLNHPYSSALRTPHKVGRFSVAKPESL